jgi:hypothetical protein
MAILNTLIQTVPTAISPPAVIVSNQLKDIAITVMLFCNLNTVDPEDHLAGQQFLDIFVVPDGESSSGINQIGNQIPIDAGDTFTFNTERLVLSPGDRIFAKTTNTNQVSVTISYVVI